MNGELQTYHNQLSQLEQGALPLAIQTAGDKAKYKFVEFFFSTLANSNTREAYARASFRFFNWCEQQGLELAQVHPIAVAGYIRQLEQELSPASVKQHLAAIRMLFDWFVVEGVTSNNPASSVKGPKHNPKRGKTPVLTPEDTRRLFDSIELKTVKDYRDRAILGVLFYAWVRVSSVCDLDVRDYYHVGRQTFLKFKEKGGKEQLVPVHHKAVEYLEAYLEQAQIDSMDKLEKKRSLFRTIDNRRQLTERRMNRNDVLRMVRSRASKAGISAEITVHTARATGITTYLSNGGALEAAQDIANHADPRTTRLYDRRKDTIDRAEIERVQY